MDNSIIQLMEVMGAEKKSIPLVETITKRICNIVKIPLPGLWVCNNDLLNAFTIGYALSDAQIAVTKGLLKYCSTREICGVIAHEIGHILRNDVLRNTYWAMKLNGINITANLVIGEIENIFLTDDNPNNDFAAIAIGTLASVIINKSLLANLYAKMRASEIETDILASCILKSSEPLSSALNKIEYISNREGWHLPHLDLEKVNHLFIVAPFKKVMSTHPSTETRMHLLSQYHNYIFSTPRFNLDIIFCNYCGATIPCDSLYCSYCGQSLKPKIK
jgi:heat shock protein HtpX